MLHRVQKTSALRSYFSEKERCLNNSWQMLPASPIGTCRSPARRRSPTTDPTSGPRASFLSARFCSSCPLSPQTSEEGFQSPVLHLGGSHLSPCWIDNNEQKAEQAEKSIILLSSVTEGRHRAIHCPQDWRDRQTEGQAASLRHMTVTGTSARRKT